MNERIKQLALQATEYMQHGFTTQETYFDKEKFAELIVQECIQQIETSFIADPYTGKPYDNIVNRVLTGEINNIKEHFGVEE